MSFRVLSLVLIIYSTYTKADNPNPVLEFNFPSDSLYLNNLKVEPQLEKYQTLTVQDLIINSKKVTNSHDPELLKKESFLEKLSFKTKRIFNNNASKKTLIK